MDHLDLVQQALAGRREALHELAEKAYKPLHSYVLRITFREEITDDIVQETLLEMYRIFAQLKQAELFWPWLCKIALNKVRKHSETQNRHQRLLRLHAEQSTSPPSMDGLASAINHEFHQVILQSLSRLSDRQRAVLSMRCYENMPYSQIAQIMDLSELGCRLLFVRARKKLQSHLSSFGYGQKSVLLALVLFGKLTAPSKAAAAQMTISPSVLNAGMAASAIALATTKTALLTAGALSVAAGGLAVWRPAANPGIVNGALADPVFTSDVRPAASASLKDSFYFFPQGANGPVLTRFTVQGEVSTLQILQNDSGNYTYDAGRQEASVNNCHYWKTDLSVITLPTDSPDLEAFLAAVENRPPQHDRFNGSSENLFIMISGQDPPRYFGASNYNALLEERFRYNWLADSGIVDRRDDLHRQGRCLVKISGSVRDKPVNGSGLLPFSYAQALETPPYLSITVGKTVFIGSPAGTAVCSSDKTVLGRFPADTIFTGLTRPWAGLHVLDSVRRDAALHRIRFRTSMDPSNQQAQVCLMLTDGRIEYTIDMNRDWLTQIVFIDSAATEVGRLDFTYVPVTETGTIGSNAGRFVGGSPSVSPPIHWLSALFQGTILVDEDN